MRPAKSAFETLLDSAVAAPVMAILPPLSSGSIRRGLAVARDVGREQPRRHGRGLIV